MFAVSDGGVGYLWRVSYIKNGTVTDYGKERGLPSRALLVFARDRQGAIGIATGKDALARLEGSRWERSELIAGSLAQPRPFSWITPEQFGW
jgi:hypothetical protein